MVKNLFQLFSVAKINRAGRFLILAGSLVWSLTMVKSGLVYNYGMGFWGPNGHDGVWHIALAQSLANGSWRMPIFSGEVIRNYHIGFDLFLAILHKLTFIPITTLYFQILPPIFGILIGYFAYHFTLRWTKSDLKAWWATFFVYFAGGWGWIITLFRNGEIGGESIFWSQQSISTLVNPPFALSLLLIFLGLSFLVKGLKTKDRRLLIIATFLFGILVQIKVYAGILALTGLSISGFLYLFQRKGITLIKVFAGALIISILIFSPVSNGVGTTLLFKPFWFLEEMVSSPDRLYWPRMASAIANYKLAGNWVKLIPAYGLLFMIFWFGNLGTRVIKEPNIFSWLKNWKNLSWVEVFTATLIVTGAIIPIFFVQSGTAWNTIQFIYYSLVFSGILAGGTFAEFIQKSKLNASVIYIIEATIIVLTVPTTFGTLMHYLPLRPPAMISNYELEALEFLSKQTDGIVLTQPYNRERAILAQPNPPRPLYLYESTAYVSAFSGKRTYLEDEVNLEITGYDWRERRNEVEPFFGDNCKIDVNFFTDKEVSYIYLVKQNLCKREFETIADKIFENLEVVVFKVN